MLTRSLSSPSSRESLSKEQVWTGVQEKSGLMAVFPYTLSILLLTVIVAMNARIVNIGGKPVQTAVLTHDETLSIDQQARPAATATSQQWPEAEMVNNQTLVNSSQQQSSPPHTTVLAVFRHGHCHY
ncbi:hypothetical protein PoB_005284500 [Plakobranchus ocellatus]|uniref:Uncharacterized protein n=1 Tax=Plakobranchus ocellatus TaxID=259542 RepID=A0AAV4C4J7_9GAST|nr:hypothetical protein PoB_005284500 [Plakobranchus ocellatus]